MESDDDGHRQWADRIATSYGHVIREQYDPATQPAMKSNAGAWLRWNPNDVDVRLALEEFRFGVRRSDLRAMSGQLNSVAKRRRAFVTTLLWGVGTTNRYYGRHSKALAFPGLDDVLEQSVSAVQREDLSSGWSAIYRLPGLDFRFFTKWLWVAGADGNLKAPPLVFDQRVIDGLAKTDWPSHPRQINYKQRWLNFCADAAAVGERVGVSGEWIEYWLFDGARSDAG